MKKLVVSMFFMVAASFFFVCGVFADSQVDFSLQPGETMVVYLDNEYTFEVPHDSAGDYGFFNWTVSERPISHSGLIQSSVVNYAGASMPNITVSAQRDNTNSGNVTFMFDSAVGAGAKVRIYISVAVTLQNQTDNPISGYMNLNLSAWNYNGNAIPNMGSANDKLNQILDALGSSSSSSKFLGDDALFYLNTVYFQGVNGSSGTRSFNSDGVCEFTSAATTFPYRVHYFGGDGTSFGSQSVVGLQAGDYVFYYSAPVEVSNIIIYSWEDNYTITDHVDIIRDIFHVGYFVIHVNEPISSWQFSLEFNDGFTGVIYGGMARMDINQSAQDAINPDQSGLVSDVDNAGQQQQSQEEQLWTNINSYKGELSFNLDDWSEAAGGLSYVSGIFMQIWNNSPTQIIILSLMLGIAMLSIGRGVHAAVRVSRNRNDD